MGFSLSDSSHDQPQLIPQHPSLIQRQRLIAFSGTEWLELRNGNLNHNVFIALNLVMDSQSVNSNTEFRELGSPKASSLGFHKNGNFLSIYGEVEAKHRLLLVQWLSSLIPSLYFPINVTDGELRACLSNGTVLCQILNRLRPGTVNVVSEPDNSLPSHSENVKSFLKALDGMGLQRFEISDLEKGSMKAVVDCLLTLRAKSLQNALADNNHSNSSSPGGNSPFTFPCSPPFNGQPRRVSAGSKLQRVFSSPLVAAEPASLIHHVNHKFHEVFQLKPGSYADLPAAKISEMMKSNSLDNAPTQSLLSVVNGILEESLEKRNGEIPHRVACLLRKVTQEIERRMSTQAEHLRTQNNLFKAREEKYQSRIRVLEALASGNRDESEIFASQFQQLMGEKIKEEEKKDEDKSLEISALKQELETAKRTYEVQFSQLEEELLQKVEEYEFQLEELRIQAEKIKEEGRTADEKEIIRLVKEQEENNMEILALKQELETTKKTYEVQCSRLEAEAKDAKAELRHKSQEYEHRLEEIRNKTEKIKEEAKKGDEKEIMRLIKEHEDKKNSEITALKQEFETTKKIYQVQCSQLEAEAKDTKEELRQKSKEYEHRLEELRNNIKELEAASNSKYQKLKMKMSQWQTVIKFHSSSLQNLRLSWESIKQDVKKEQMAYAEECSRLGVNIKSLVQAAENYRVVLAENKKLFNEVQELKGNIRVYCRIRPFLSGKREKQSIVEHIDDNDLVVSNPSKEGKDTHRSFKFNKVFGPTITQAEVYADIQSFIRSVLDGYNVCIFAYGQTGSGKTYTMTGPNGATSETIGVNYRALNDLFSISTSRSTFIVYEIGVQMVEIYNEQVRDLLSTEGSSKRTLGILTHSQAKGLAVPDASLFPVKSPSDVIKLMDIGLKNRAISATAMNERSSRSHSVVSIHVRGKDLKSGSTQVGNLHLVDLAGSERVDRSEVTGDRLKEAQHINKSLSALGDVIFALSQKSPHVPYRNSKLTQLLQTSLGGQAKTLMFVQINSDVSSFSETVSTLKFAERVSGVELGAARSSKDGKDVRELMEQVASMKSTILAKDEEIERLHLHKGSVGSILKQNQKSPSGSIKHHEDDTHRSIVDHIHQNEFLHQPGLSGEDIAKNIAANIQTPGFSDADLDERSSVHSENDVAPPSIGTDSSENSILTEGTKSSDKIEKSKAIPKNVHVVRKLSRTSSITTPTKEPLKKPPSGIKKSFSIGQLKPAKRWQ
ncbi:kinesin-like protein KIN-14K [Abrus precatorius]|uniref:Kinesin-like protein KIN-14K n=1 Tax=Abrus precatorius TaxID=3816 RepID=A0A8B8KHD1_ABRPR|nr:kinesin-like protein KIN-14K [Abrus precatorius]